MPGAAGSEDGTPGACASCGLATEPTRTAGPTVCPNCGHREAAGRLA